MKILKFSSILILLLCLLSCEKNSTENKDSSIMKGSAPADKQKKKVLYVDSYNIDYPWIQELMKSLLGVFEIEMDENGSFDDSEGLVDLKVYHMDTKNNKEEDFILNAAEEAKRIIEQWQPDIVIASDDNASKYLIAPYYKDSPLPVVFCGVNGDSSVYGFPAANITGMEEVKLVKQLIQELSSYSDGTDVGILMTDNLSAHVEVKEFEKLLGYPLIQQYARDYREWESFFHTMQQDLDILLIGALDGLPGWDHNPESLADFMEENTTIPTGSWLEWLTEMVLMTLAEKASEMGEWTGRTALEILNGTSPSEIPIVRNKQAVVYLNMAIAKKLGVIFPQDLIERAHLVKGDESNEK